MSGGSHSRPIEGGIAFGSLESARAAKHIQVAHCVRPVLVFDGWQFRHYPFDQQQAPTLRKRSVTFLEDHRTAFIVPIMNHTLEDNDVGDVRNRIEEIARQEARPITDAHAL
jgi:hypothetical protein